MLTPQKSQKNKKQKTKTKQQDMTNNSTKTC